MLASSSVIALKTSRALWASVSTVALCVDSTAGGAGRRQSGQVPQGTEGAGGV